MAETRDALRVKPSARRSGLTRHERRRSLKSGVQPNGGENAAGIKHALRREGNSVEGGHDPESPRRELCPESSSRPTPPTSDARRSIQGDSAVLLDERVNSLHLCDDHAAEQLIERLAWAVSDARTRSLASPMTSTQLTRAVARRAWAARGNSHARRDAGDSSRYRRRPIAKLCTGGATARMLDPTSTSSSSAGAGGDSEASRRCTCAAVAIASPSSTPPRGSARAPPARARSR